MLQPVCAYQICFPKMSGTLTLLPYGAEEDFSLEVPVITEGFPPSSNFNNQTFETTPSTDHTGDYSSSAGTSSEGTEGGNPEGHAAGKDGFDFQYGERVLHEFRTSNPAGRPAGEQVPTAHFGTRNLRNMSPIHAFDPSGLGRAVRFHPTVSTGAAEGGRRSVLSMSHSSRMPGRGVPQVHLTRPPVVSI
jgi:hypothetical protein